MISAYLLVALHLAEKGPAENVARHYNEGMKIFTETSDIHREVTVLAWPFRFLENAVSRVFRSRPDQSVVYPSESHSPSVQIVSYRSISDDIATMLKGLTYNTTVLDTSPHSRCHNTVEFFHINLKNDLVYIFIDESISTGLLRAYIEFAVYSGVSKLPIFYPFGIMRNMPLVLGPGEYIPASYNSSSFAIYNPPSIPNTKTAYAEALCRRGVPLGAIIEVIFRPYSPYDTNQNSFPLRCDDEGIPMSLRISDTNEEMREDWRDTILAPVLPRKPVPPF